MCYMLTLTLTKSLSEWEWLKSRVHMHSNMSRMLSYFHMLWLFYRLLRLAMDNCCGRRSARPVMDMTALSTADTNYGCKAGNSSKHA
jgi:hypothetical protein